MTEKRSTRLPQRSVDSDGNISDNITDILCEQSIYIPPGDVCREAYRLSTFKQFSVTCPIIRKSLAKSGFYFIGFCDGVKCFACARTVEQWEETDNPAEPKWHKINCPFSTGEESGNVSLPSLFQSTATAVPSAPSSSAQARPVEHRTHFPQCRMVVGSEPDNIPVHDHPETEKEKERKYPLRFPANPHMRSIAARMRTFWPMGKTAATPADISQPGFFFIGDRDRAKCWYCNGGLQDWEHDDIPWIEHAKWFPNCQFLLRVKGHDFVYRHLTMNPHLPQPIIARRDDFLLKGVGQYEPIVASTPAPVLIDPQVADLLEDRIFSQNEANPDDVYESASELLEDVHKAEEDRGEEEQGKLGPNKLYIKDKQRRKFLIDSGSWTCATPATSYEKLNCPRGPDSVAANGSNIATYGKKRMFLKLSNGKSYPYDFFIADVKEQIIGADFIRHYKLVINLRNNRLEDPDGSHICGTLQSVTASVNLSCIENAGGDPQDEWDEEEELPFLELSYICSLLSTPGSGKYNMWYFGDDDEEMDQDMYRSMEGTSTSVTNVTATKRLLGAEGNRESLQEALNKIEEERMCKICFTNQADMVFKPCAHMCCCIECTQAITQCPVCRKKIEQAIKTYLK